MRSPVDMTTAAPPHEISVPDEAVKLQPPPPSKFAHLKPTDVMGAFYVALASLGAAFGVYFANSDNTLVWALGQIVLALTMVQCFALLHEAGHRTLFRNVRLNRSAGHMASLLAAIPFENWKAVHRIHHRWTGWQDLDATTAALVPRTLSWWEKTAVNVCWAISIPSFSVLYRLQNYWNLARLFRLMPRLKWRLAVNSILLLFVYVLAAVFVGPLRLLQVAGAAVVLSLIMQDVLILSQHTHIPMHLSGGEKVQPFPPAEQEVFTRSLKFPSWFSALVLVGMDAHELHHLYPSIPGYRLNRIDYETHNSVRWWRWIWKAKGVPGEVFLMQNRNQTGFDI